MDLIQHLQVTTQTRFDRRGTPHPVMQYSYFVDDHGPFLDEFQQGEDTPEAVQAAMQKRIKHLKDVGALPGQA